MRSRIAAMLLVATLAGVPAIVGCEGELSHEESTKVNSNGTSVHKEETVKQQSDGTIVKEKEKSVDSTPSR